MWINPKVLKGGGGGAYTKQEAREVGLAIELLGRGEELLSELGDEDRDRVLVLVHVNNELDDADLVLGSRLEGDQIRARPLRIRVGL